MEVENFLATLNFVSSNGNKSVKFYLEEVSDAKYALISFASLSNQDAFNRAVSKP